VTDGHGDSRITEVQLDENSLISINIALYVAEDQVYPEFEDVDLEDATDEELAEAVVDGLYSISEVREISGELVDRFPTDEPLTVKAALWVRAVAGLHLFRDANHRTGLRSLRDILSANGIEMYGDPLGDKMQKKNERVIELSKRVRQRERTTEGKEYRGQEMYEKDELFGIWLSYFNGVL